MAFKLVKMARESVTVSPEGSVSLEGKPFSKEMEKSSGVLGAVSGESVNFHISSGGVWFGSSYRICKR